MPCRFPRSSRIRRSVDYQLLRSRGHRLNSRNFSMYLLPIEGSPVRLGLTVSRKVGCAVVRNRLKRLLREFFRSNCNRLPTGMSLSIVARSSAAGLSYSGLCTELEAALRGYFRDGHG